MLLAGAVGGGLLLGSAVLREKRRARRLATRGPEALPAPARFMQMEEGRACYYVHPGEGTPVVLLHSLNAAASSFEMKPLFEHLAATTSRPIYALDWLGFGRSDRPPLHYTPALYERQLRRFLKRYTEAPVDLVALSLGCEYAARVTAAEPGLVRRFVGIAPTALGASDEGTLPRLLGVRLSSYLGAFELFFYRLTRPKTLARFYRRQIFLDPAALPPELVDHARATTQVRGAHHAPRFFVEGSLFLGPKARAAYARLRVPTCFLLPEHADPTIQRFERAPSLQRQNPEHLRVETVPGGLLPHWEAPAPFFQKLDAFLQ